MSSVCIWFHRFYYFIIFFNLSIAKAIVYFSKIKHFFVLIPCFVMQYFESFFVLR